MAKVWKLKPGVALRAGELRVMMDAAGFQIQVLDSLGNPKPIAQSKLLPQNAPLNGAQP
ncbi:MAG: hypothetical protein ACM31P_19495 [Actinomycetota bacterium]